MGYDEGFEVDDLDTVCENCLAVDEDVQVTFDHWSGRNLCLECEPRPMMDDGTRLQTTRDFTLQES